MGISEHLSAADVMLDVSVRNKWNLIELMAKEAAGRLGRSQQEILDALQSRETLGSTSVGKGIALPHAQLQGATRPIVLFARLGRPIEFDIGDAEPVDLVFLVLWPAAATKGLLDAMSEIARSLRDPELLRHLRLAETSEDVIQLLRSHQEAFGKRRSVPIRRDR
jgi:PTS system nitrogen regulatory IIA component